MATYKIQKQLQILALFDENELTVLLVEFLEHFKRAVRRKDQNNENTVVANIHK